MPIYEYICTSCNGRFQKLVRGFQTPPGLQCPRCSSTALRKAVSRVAFVPSADARMDAMADPRVFGDVDENDPKSVARWAKRMGQQMGDDLGDDWEEMVDEMMDEEMSGEGEGGEGSSKAPDDLGWG